MEKRYELFSEMTARNIKQYNNKVAKAQKPADKEAPEILPYIVIVIDELADLMILASRDVEVALTRLAQMARAAGIHLILATQRPSVDVLTGIIKANFPTRLTFQVSSRTDSRTIIDTVGAENLLGSGDMLFLPPGTAKLQRIHGAYISEEELSQITAFLRSQKKPEYDEEVTATSAIQAAESNDDNDYDERYDDAVALITEAGQASISMIQRHLRIGYNRAARIIEKMEKEGIVGPSDGAKPRDVLVSSFDRRSPE
jgi:S-DNA-T family DNA segregation ATPase FtsK/SpoIIIE